MESDFDLRLRFPVYRLPSTVYRGHAIGSAPATGMVQG
jgi:hypothetical protein